MESNGAKRLAPLEALPKDVVTQSERDRLLLAAAEMLREHGYAALTADQICAHSGVSRETFDDLFAGVDDCLRAAANTLLGEIVAIVTSRISPDKPIPVMVRDALAAVLAMMAQRPAFAHMIFVEGRTLDPTVRDIYNSGVNVLQSLLDQVRVDGPSDAEIPANSARAACGAVGMMIRHEVMSGRAEGLPQLLPSTTYSFLVAFLGQEQALAFADEARRNPPRIELPPFGRAHMA